MYASMENLSLCPYMRKIICLPKPYRSPVSHNASVYYKPVERLSIKSL